MPGWLYTTVPLLAAIAYALAFRQRFTLRFYFATQLVATVVLEGAVLFWVPRTSPTFGALYAGMTVLILIASQLFVWDQLQSVWRRVYLSRIVIGAAAVAIVPAAITYGDLAKPLRYYDWIYLAESFSLVFQAMTLALICRFLAGVYRTVSLTLLVTWLALAGFRLGFALHLPREEWVGLNKILPYAIAVTGFLTVGTLLHRYERSLRWTTPARRA